MPAYLYWGDDDFRLSQSIQTLQQKVLDPTWQTFNFDKIDSTRDAQAMIQGLNQCMSPPFGTGDRLIWLLNPPLTATDFASELERTLPQLPSTTHLLMTSTSKPDGRSKTYKFIQKHATLQEFATIPPWKTEELIRHVRTVATSLKINLDQPTSEFLAEAIGGDTRQLQNELEKLKLYSLDPTQPHQPITITRSQAEQLIQNSAQTTLQLATHIRNGQTDQALRLLNTLLQNNEAPLKIVITLSNQFRTWYWLKLLIESGERDERILAQTADIKNPKRIYFLRKEIQPLHTSQLQSSLYLMLELEKQLKSGASPTLTLQTTIIQLCKTFI
jgi:DNA polymerase-3 subunit delta